MKILGLDLSTTSTGYCITDGVEFTYGLIKPKATLPLMDRIFFVTDSINNLLILNPNVDTIVIEEVYVAYAQSALVLGKLQGSISNMLRSRNLTPIFYEATHVRKVIGLKGRLSGKEGKKIICQFISNYIHSEITKDDIADAIAVTLSHLKEKGLT